MISLNLTKVISTVSREKCQIRALQKALSLLPLLCLYSLDVCKMRYLHVHSRRTTQVDTEIWGETAYLEENLASKVNETLIADLIFLGKKRADSHAVFRKRIRMYLITRA